MNVVKLRPSLADVYAEAKDRWQAWDIATNSAARLFKEYEDARAMARRLAAATIAVTGHDWVEVDERGDLGFDVRRITSSVCSVDVLRSGLIFIHSSEFADIGMQATHKVRDFGDAMKIILDMVARRVLFDWLPPDETVTEPLDMQLRL